MKPYTQLLKLAAQMDRIGLRDPADELEEAQVLQYLMLVRQYLIPETQPTSSRRPRHYNT